MSHEVVVEVSSESLQNEVITRRVSLWRNRYILSLMLAVGITMLGGGIVSPLRTLYARAEGATNSEAGLMGAAYLASAFIFLLPFGWLSDRVNRVGLIIGGLILHVILLIAYIYVNDGELFIALRFIEGISSAAVMPPARALLVDLVPPRRNGEAFGMMSAVMIFGILAGPPVGTFLASIFGYSIAYWCAVGIMAPVIVVVWLSFRNFHLEQHLAKTIQKDAVRGSFADLLTSQIILGCIVRFAVSLGPSLGMSIWSLYMADLGYSLPMIGWTYAVYAVPILLVAPSAGRFSDRYGRMAMMFVGTLAVGLIWVGYGLINSYILFLVVGVIEGSFIAIAESANDGYLADHTPPGMNGRGQGLFNAVSQFASLVGASVAGFLYDVNHALPFFVMGGTQAVLVVLAMGLWLYLQLGQRRRVLVLEK